MVDYYDFASIRRLLSEGFTGDQLLNLCFDEAVLRPVYDEYMGQVTRSELVREIIDHAHRHLALDAVLSWAQKHNPARYEAHGPYRHAPISGESAPGDVLPDNDLGQAIILGGTYREMPLRLFATEWAQYGMTWVRSGWLFVPQWTAGHAVTFFKIHRTDNHKGYIHLVDVASPEHRVWLKTAAGFAKEATFHYVSHPVALWHFEW